MKRLILLGALLSPATALAWGTKPADPATPTSLNYTGSAKARAAAKVSVDNVVTVSAPATLAAPNPAPARRSIYAPHARGTAAAVPDNTPDLAAPLISGGNPCGLAAGGGASQPGIAAFLSMMWEGKGCTRREDAALLWNMHYRIEAKNRLCDGDYFQKAFADAGNPCPDTLKEWEATWVKQGYHKENGGWVR